MLLRTSVGVGGASVQPRRASEDRRGTVRSDT
jgi:hypothetical protein